MAKRSYEKVFERRQLDSVDHGGFYVKIDMFKVLNKLDIQTAENNIYCYDESVIMKRSKSATSFNQVEKFTKTQFIELFTRLSTNDIWSAEYETFDKSEEWELDLTTTIQKLPFPKACKYIKKNFKSFGKRNRTIIGHKINTDSGNNYYMVRDLEKHFELMDNGVDVDIAKKESIRNLDVNSLHYLIFNGVKYVLKSN